MKFILHFINSKSFFNQLKKLFNQFKKFFNQFKKCNANLKI